MTNAETPSAKASRLKRPVTGVAVGLFASVLFMLGFYWLARYLQPFSGLILVSVLLGLPAGSSAVAVWVSTPVRDARFRDVAVLSLYVTGLGLLAAALVLREGAVCLAMAAPIFFGIGLLGAWGAVALNRLTRSRHSASMIVLLPMLLLMVERQEIYPVHHGAVSTTVVVAAPADRVWREAAEVRDIRPEELGWTITQDLLNVPKPVDARLTGSGVGAVRHAHWARGVRFEEHIVAWEPGVRLAWTFKVPESSANAILDEHLRLDEGYLALKDGEYRLEPLADGRTRLTLTTRYQVRTPANAYARLWAGRILGDVHGNVLRVVKGRAESAER